MGRLIDLTIGERFGRWPVIALDPERYRRRQARWLCACSCGEQRVVLGYSLREGKSTSCGCKRRETLKKRNTKHGMWGTRTYSCWRGILQRCHNPRHPKYP